MPDLADRPDNAPLQSSLIMRKILCDCARDGSDMDYDGDAGHLPARLLSAYAEFMQTDHDRKMISDNNLPHSM